MNYRPILPICPRKAERYGLILQVFRFLKRFPRHSLFLEAFVHATWSYLQSLNFYSPGGSSSAACWGCCGPSHRVGFLLAAKVLYWETDDQ